MIVDCKIYLFISLFVQLFVECQRIPPHQTTPPLPSQHGSLRMGVGYPGEPLRDHTTSDTVVIVLDANAKAGDKVKIPKTTGVMMVYSEEYVPKLDTAVLSTDIFPSPDGKFFRNIVDPREATFIGFLLVERPVPDPDLRFEILANSSLLNGVPRGVREMVDPEALIPSPTKGCTSNTCIQIIPSADIFYFGPAPTNTACLSSITSPPNPPPPPELNMNSSFVYVVYQQAQRFDMCRNWQAGGEGPPLTFAYLSEWLSTIEYKTEGPPATKAMNFADLPCGPSNVAQQLEPGVPYSPILAVEALVSAFTVSRANGSVQYCDIAAVRDPPVRAVRVGKISGPKDGDGAIP